MSEVKHLWDVGGVSWCGGTGVVVLEVEDCTCSECLHKSIRHHLLVASQHNRRLSQLENEIIQVAREEEE